LHYRLYAGKCSRSAVRQLIELGKQKRYLLYDEIYEILPDEVVGLPDEVDEIYLRFDELGIAVVDRPERYVNRDEIDSTPPATYTPSSPARMRWAASAIVCRPEEQNRFTVIPETLAGRPARMAI